jgi:hypothetical protein
MFANVIHQSLLKEMHFVLFVGVLAAIHFQRVTAHDLQMPCVVQNLAHDDYLSSAFNPTYG